MKKIVTVFLIIGLAMMLIAGCASQEAAPEKSTEPTKTVASKDTEEKTAEPAPVAEEPKEVVAAPAPTKVPDKKVAELLKKHVGRITSLKYMYQDETINPEEWETWVKGDLMHVKLREMDNVKGDVYIDNVYLNLKTKTAKGYCERKVMRCTSPNEAIDVAFSKYYRKGPLDWINGVTYAKKEAEEQMQMRNVWKLSYEENGKTTILWVDEYYGVPVKVHVVDGSEIDEYVFEDIAFNTIDDSDLTHKSIDTAYRD
ncbi:MAG: hypothetical protein V1729_06405 [Candidatus Woesearchaeota archaeon]